VPLTNELVALRDSCYAQVCVAVCGIGGNCLSGELSELFTDLIRLLADLLQAEAIKRSQLPAI